MNPCLNKNRLFLDRTVGKGRIDTKTCLAWNVTGPTLRATGMAHDIRKSNPYCGFEQYEFDIPTQTDGDVFSRYLVKGGRDAAIAENCGTGIG